MECVAEALPQAEMRFVEQGKHSPHSEEAEGEESNRTAAEFLNRRR